MVLQRLQYSTRLYFDVCAWVCVFMSSPCVCSGCLGRSCGKEGAIQVLGTLCTCEFLGLWRSSRQDSLPLSCTHAHTVDGCKIPFAPRHDTMVETMLRDIYRGIESEAVSERCDIWIFTTIHIFYSAFLRFCRRDMTAPGLQLGSTKPMEGWGRGQEGRSTRSAVAGRREVGLLGGGPTGSLVFFCFFLCRWLK